MFAAAKMCSYPVNKARSNVGHGVLKAQGLCKAPSRMHSRGEGNLCILLYTNNRFDTRITDVRSSMSLNMGMRCSTVLPNKPTLTEKNLPDQSGKVGQARICIAVASLSASFTTRLTFA